MKFRLPLVLLLFTKISFSQIVNSVTYPMVTYTNVPLEDMTGATTVFGPGINSNAFSSPIKIGAGFTFCLAGYCYDTLLINVKGKIYLGNRVLSQYQPVIMPFSTDMSTGTDGYIQYKVIGSYPNRRFVAHFKVHLKSTLTSYSAQDQFQISLYESGRIDFNFGTTPISWSGANYLMNIGYDIAQGQPYEGIYVDVKVPFSASIPLYGTAWTSNQDVIPGQSRISFLPDSSKVNLQPAYIGNACTKQIDFVITDTTHNENYIEVLRSLDGTHYNKTVKRINTNTLATNQTYYISDTGLTMGTHYYYAITSGNLTKPPDTTFLDATTIYPMLSGVRTIPGDYATLTEALYEVRCKQLIGNLVLELGASYNSSSEVFPLVIDNTIWTDTNKRLTIRLASGATNIAIHNPGANMLFKLSNAKYFELDGRPGGVGNVNELTLVNDTSSNNVIYIGKKSVFNSIRNCNIKGKGRWDFVQQALVMIDSLNNSNNAITSCEFSSASPSTWVETAIAANGSKYSMNSNNVVEGCHFNRFGGYAYRTRSSGSDVYGVDIKNGNTDWTFSDNSFYMTDTLKTGAINTCLYINSSVGQNFKVINNKFGGSGPACSGNKMEISATAAGTIKYIYLNAGGLVSSLIRHNEIRNINYRSDNVGGTCCYGYDFVETKCKKLVVDSNLIGDTLTRSSIDYYFPYTSANYEAIDVGILRLKSFNTLPSTGVDFTVNDNVFGSLNLHAKISINCIDVVYSSTSRDVIRIKSNSIGGSMDSSIVCYGDVTGVIGTSCGEDSIIVDENIMKNISTGIAAYKHLAVGVFRGVWFKQGNTTTLPLSNRSVQITKNRIFNIRSTSGGHNASGQSNGSLGIQGIQTSLQQGKMLIEDNIMHTFHNSVEGSITGIDAINGSTAITETFINRNFMHNFWDHSNGNYSGSIFGIWCGMGVRMENNMIALGNDELGQVVDSSIYVTGIRVRHSNFDTVAIYHNSISVGGGAQNKTYGNGRALDIEQNVQGNYKNVKVKNNIFSCFRFGNNSSANSIVDMQYSSIIKTLLVCDYNQYYAGGTSTFMEFGSTFQSWQQTTGMDLHSFYNPPKYINASGGSQSCDLHLQFANFSEGKGTPIGVAGDFDSDNRQALTPVDIGADAGNFHLLPQINLGPDKLICSGDSSVLSVGAFDQYLWSTGASSSSITISSAGVYSITVTDALGYQASDSVALQLKPLPNVSAGITDSVLCAGETTTLTATGATSYTWSSGAITSTVQVVPPSTMVYTVTGLGANGCKNSDTVAVAVNQLPTLIVSSTSVTICSGQTTTLSATGAQTYSWSTGVMGPDIVISPTTTVTYTLYGTDVYGCSNTSAYAQSVSTCTGIQNFDNSLMISVYPNPNEGEFVVNVDGDVSLKLFILNALGQELGEYKLYNGENSISIDNLNQGLYYYRAVSDKKQVGFGKLIVR